MPKNSIGKATCGIHCSPPRVGMNNEIIVHLLQAHQFSRFRTRSLNIPFSLNTRRNFAYDIPLERSFHIHMLCIIKDMSKINLRVHILVFHFAYYIDHINPHGN